MQHRERAARLEVVEALREELRKRSGGTLVITESSEASSGTPRSLDELLALSRGRGTLGVISGRWSSGKTSLALAQVARATRAGQRAAIVDGTGWIFPPALALMEGDLTKTLVLQPPAERAVWAAEQVLRSGLFALAALLEPRRLDRAALRRLQLAAERGSALCLLIPRDPASTLPGLISLRLHVSALPPGEVATLQRVPIAAPARRRRVQVVHQRFAGQGQGQGQGIELLAPGGGTAGQERPSQISVAG